MAFASAFKPYNLNDTKMILSLVSRSLTFLTPLADVALPRCQPASMKLSVHLSEPTIKRIRTFLSCCAKIGMNHSFVCGRLVSPPRRLLMQAVFAGTVLLIEATPEKMMWRVINSAKSACLLLTLHSAFFDYYVLYQIKLLNTSVLLKVCCVSERLSLAVTIASEGSHFPKYNAKSCNSAMPHNGHQIT